MDDFLDDLLFFCQQKERFSPDIDYNRDWDTLEELGEQVEATMGEDLWKRYSDAALRCGKWESAAAFRSGLRLGIQLVLSTQPFTSS